ncbi:hypothetical protein BKA62DRAFT_691690 [Auriculariales sp. MPI-PUGE-AT-0066]|nr:hypothetical protein BKA62DRAFT_691690 [Auriculariales sp. MPI-PUGE-AT-0066]
MHTYIRPTVPLAGPAMRRSLTFSSRCASTFTNGHSGSQPQWQPGPFTQNFVPSESKDDRRASVDRWVWDQRLMGQSIEAVLGQLEQQLSQHNQKASNRTLGALMSTDVWDVTEMQRLAALLGVEPSPANWDRLVSNAFKSRSVWAAHKILSIAKAQGVRVGSRSAGRVVGAIAQKHQFTTPLDVDALRTCIDIIQDHMLDADTTLSSSGLPHRSLLSLAGALAMSPIFPDRWQHIDQLLETFSRGREKSISSGSTPAKRSSKSITSGIRRNPDVFCGLQVLAYRQTSHGDAVDAIWASPMARDADVAQLVMLFHSVCQIRYADRFSIPPQEAFRFIDQIIAHGDCPDGRAFAGLYASYGHTHDLLNRNDVKEVLKPAVIEEHLKHAREDLWLLDEQLHSVASARYPSMDIPGDLMVQNARLMAHARLVSFDSALDIWNQYLSHDHAPDAHMLGNLLRMCQRGARDQPGERLAAGRKVWQQAQDIGIPRTGEVYARWANLLRVCGEYEEAIQCIETHCAHEPHMYRSFILDMERANAPNAFISRARQALRYGPSSSYAADARRHGKAHSARSGRKSELARSDVPGHSVDM